MNPWEVLSWVVAISLIVLVSTLTVAIFVSLVVAIFTPKRKSKDSVQPISVSVFRGKGD